MEIIVKTGQIEKHQMLKEVAQPHALKQMQDMYKYESHKAVDPWHRNRVDWVEAGKNARKLKVNLDKIVPEKLTAGAKNLMWKRAKELKDEFIVGMLSNEEMHPVKGFSDNGKMVWVVDHEKIRSSRAVERNSAWYAKNQSKIREFKNIMRHLCPENPRAGDIERFRPKKQGIR